jgi:2-polyprenyl-3-methyl-5-hydroxy-6-metoxy-1,4-benzoquinol methylase
LHDRLGRGPAANDGAQRSSSGLMALTEDPEQNEASALLRMVPSFSGLRVLEIGCGDGRVTRLFAPHACSVVAIDPDAELIALMKADWPAVDARAVGIEALDLPPHSVDVAIFSWSL